MDGLERDREGGSKLMEIQTESEGRTKEHKTMFRETH